MEPTKGLFDKGSDDLERIIDKLSRENKKLAEEIADLKKKLEFVVQEYRNKGTL
jgi:cell division protein FtsB